MDELTRRRLEHNEQLFREVNEQVEEAHPHSPEGELDFICECSDRGCTARIRLSVAEYERVRARPDTFVILPGHALPELEAVVEARQGYAIVAKGAA